MTIALAALCQTMTAQEHHRPRREAFTTDTPMVHDPVMAKEDDTYYIFSTGRGIQQMTSKDRKTWTVLPQPVMSDIPSWTADSVPGFGNHVWAPDVIRWHGRWWMAYSCSTFGKNGSAIGLLSSPSLVSPSWKDEGCIVASHNRQRGADGKMTGDNWNAIDPNFVIDDTDQPWLVWGSFWDGIQLAPLDQTMHLAGKPRTIARRYDPGFKPSEGNPTSKHAGTNAIEAPFIFKHGGYYYLFVSWDYCCRGAKSNYRVAVGRSKRVEGPYLDRTGKDMALGGGTLFLEGDKKEWEAAGHCAAYTLDGKDIFICHGYSAKRDGMALLIQRSISWTADGWPELKRPRVGVVLGGGGAKGAAEVGVLKVLEECDIQIDYITGTSIGAIVGSLYAAGYSASELETMFSRQEWLSLLTDRRNDLSDTPFKQDGSITYIFGFPVIDTKSSEFGVLRGGRVEQVIDSMLSARGVVEFKDLKIPFRCVTAEVKTASEVVISDGSVAQAVRASMAIPGIFKPVRKDDRLLVDGGMMNNLPVDVARDMGADIVIAIDLQQGKPTPKESRESMLTMLGDMLGIGEIVNWVVNRPDQAKYDANRRAANIYINPPLPDYEASSFGNAKMAQMVKIGYEAATAKKSELKGIE